MRIVDYSPEHHDDFVRLNRAWIVENFGAEEPKDTELFEDLDRIRDGGAVMIVGIEDGEAVATCMAVDRGEGVWELEKLTTDRRFRGRGFAKAMMAECLERIRAAGGRKVVLNTHTKLADAVHIYRSFGFARVPQTPDFAFSRTDAQFELELTPDSSSGRPS